VKAAAALLGLSWDAVQTIMDRAVARGLERREATPIKHIGIDEKSFGRGRGIAELFRWFCRHGY
jgi:hypothetical protein